MGGIDPQRLGRGDKVRFVRAEELEHRGEHRRIAKAGAQGIGRQAGQREQAFGPAVALQQPAQCAKRQRMRISGG